MSEDLTPEGEAIAAYGAATIAAFKVLIVCLQSNGALEHGKFPEALRQFINASPTNKAAEPTPWRWGACHDSSCARANKD